MFRENLPVRRQAYQQKRPSYQQNLRYQSKKRRYLYNSHDFKSDS